MRNATVELETALEYCKAILNAESEEEILAIKGDIAEGMRANGSPEEVIENYLNGLDEVVSRLDSGEYSITEDGAIVRNEDVESIVTHEVVETEAPQVIRSAPSQANTKAGLAFGVAGAAIVASLALKKKVLKNKKNKTM